MTSIPKTHKFPTQANGPQLFHLESPARYISLLSARKRQATRDIAARGKPVLTNLLSEIIYKVVVFQVREQAHSHLFYTFIIISRFLTRVKLNRVFLPRCLCFARSQSCGFTELRVGTVRISFFHSCASPIK